MEGLNGLIEAVDFVYTPDITVVNQKQYNEHLKLYKNYVKSMNEIDQQLRDANNEEREKANTTFGVYRDLKRGETYALNGIILHELYFYNIGGDKGRPSNQVLQVLNQAFGSYHLWKADFIATAKASRGWVVLFYDQRTRTFRNISYDEHDKGGLTAGLPILVLDMYEHAYFLQYGTDKMAYIQAFLQDIKWQMVKNRLDMLMDEINQE